MVGRIAASTDLPGHGRPRRRVRQPGRDRPPGDRRRCRRRQHGRPAATARRVGRRGRGRDRRRRGRGGAVRAERPHRRASCAAATGPSRSPSPTRSTRGRAYLEAGADLVFVPGILNADATRQLVEGIGERKVSVIGLPGALSAAEYEALGVARISYGPMTQRVALTALQDVAADLYADGVIPPSTRALN